MSVTNEWTPRRAEREPTRGTAAVRNGSAPLAGQKALVTGAAQGLGHEMALALASAGCDVASFDLRGDALAGTSDKVREQGRAAIDVEVDVRDHAAVHDAVRRVLDEWDAIDIVVNNAGKGQREPFTEVTPELWGYMLDVNLTSVFNVCSAVVPSMIKRRSGRIVTISSVAALRGGRLLGRTAYAAAKGGVIAFTKSLAYELAEHSITVNCIAPGIHNTPRRAKDTSEERERVLNRVPMRELGDPKDLAQTVVFLSLPSSRYVTGVVFAQDGGHSI
jgi:NAD(P)-dependent dehydrogenase (short-subunit alcohol dehydrogenase family)